MKKKNLVRAITLGLLLGGVFAGNAWAADFVSDSEISSYGEDISITDYDSIEVNVENGNGKYGISGANCAINLEAAKDITVYVASTAEGTQIDTTAGISSQTGTLNMNSGGNISIQSNSTLNNMSNNALQVQGITASEYIEGSATINATGNFEAIANGDGRSCGIQLMTLSSAKITADGGITAKSNDTNGESNGVYIDKATVLMDAKAGDINIEGETSGSGAGAWGRGLFVHTDGNGGHGNDVTLNGGNINITGINDKDYYGVGLEVRKFSDDAVADNKVVLNASKDVNITAQSKNVAMGVYVMNGSDVDIKSDRNIAISSAGEETSYGIYARTGNTVSLEALAGSITVDTNKGNGYSIYADGYNNNVCLTSKHNTIISSGNAINAYNGSVVDIVSTEKLTNITGDITVYWNAKVNADFATKASNLTGKVTTVDTYEGNVYERTATNLNFTDSASWTMTGNSNVTNLGIDNAFVDMTANDKGNASTLTVDKTQTGSGTTFAIDLDAANKNNKAASATSDYIYLNGSSEGTHYIAFDVEASKLATDMSVGDKLFFAYVDNDKDGESAEFATAGGIDLEKASAENIYNYKFGVDKKENTDKTGNDWYIGLTDKNENENITTVDDMMGSGYALGTELDRLNKRMGESRYLTDEKGLWVRYRHARVGMDNSFKTNSNMFQLGYDKERLEKDGRHYRGGALDYTDANTSLSAGGSGEQERYSLSLYDTWMGDKGHYRDLVIRGGRINSEFDVNARSNETINSDYHQWFGSISGEWGRKKDTGHDWYFEPQTQLQIARVGGADYMTNYGVRVEQDAATSVIGRVGFRLGREYDKDDATKRDNYYIKADVLHEFCGDQGFTVTGADGSLSKEYDGKDTWFDVGIGADITISRDTYFWVDVERTLGGDFDRTWQINGGFRWEFK